MAKCGNCNAVINPRWESCLVCDSPVNATITVEPEKEQKAEKLDRELEQDAIPIKDKGEQIISLHTKIVLDNYWDQAIKFIEIYLHHKTY